MSRSDFRERAVAVRGIPLETVLLAQGAIRDPRDRSKWHTERGPLSITAEKFFDWHLGRGGGGAIDLVMHLAAVDCREAVRWLEHHLAGVSVTVNRATSSGPPEVSPANGSPLRMPARYERMWGRVRAYLLQRRHLADGIIHVDVLGIKINSRWRWE